MGRLDDRVIPPDWEALAGRILASARKGCAKVMVIGGVDSGKTTLCKFLAAKACAAGMAPGFVDADVGQSTLGPPSTIGAKILHKPEEAFCDDVRPPFMRFLGGMSPSGRVFACVAGARRALDWVRENGAQFIVIDTTGLVDGELGKELKTRKVDLLAPDILVAIARETELEHILAPLEKLGMPVERLRRAEAAVVRSPSVRQKFRLDKFQEYFRDSRLQTFSFDQFAIADCPSNFAPHFAPGQVLSTLPLLERWSPVGLLVGLEDATGRCLAVGLIESFDVESRRMTIRAPGAEIDKARCVRIGRSGIE